MKTKTSKTPLMMSEAYGLMSCTSNLALESKLSRRPEVQYSLVPKLIHHGGKNTVSLRSTEQHTHALSLDLGRLTLQEGQKH